MIKSNNYIAILNEEDVDISDHISDIVINGEVGRVYITVSFISNIHLIPGSSIYVTINDDEIALIVISTDISEIGKYSIECRGESTRVSDPYISRNSYAVEGGCKTSDDLILKYGGQPGSPANIVNRMDCTIDYGDDYVRDGTIQDVLLAMVNVIGGEVYPDMFDTSVIYLDQTRPLSQEGAIVIKNEEILDFIPESKELTINNIGEIIIDYSSGTASYDGTLNNYDDAGDQNCKIELDPVTGKGIMYLPRFYMGGTNVGRFVGDMYLKDMEESGTINGNSMSTNGGDIHSVQTITVNDKSTSIFKVTGNVLNFSMDEFGVYQIKYKTFVRNIQAELINNHWQFSTDCSSIIIPVQPRMVDSIVSDDGDIEYVGDSELCNFIDNEFKIIGNVETISATAEYIINGVGSRAKMSGVHSTYIVSETVTVDSERVITTSHHINHIVSVKSAFTNANVTANMINDKTISVPSTPPGDPLIVTYRTHSINFRLPKFAINHGGSVVIKNDSNVLFTIPLRCTTEQYQQFTVESNDGVLADYRIDVAGSLGVPIDDIVGKVVTMDGVTYTIDQTGGFILQSKKYAKGSYPIDISTITNSATMKFVVNCEDN